MKRFRTITWIGPLALLLTGSVAAWAAETASVGVDSENVSKLLSDAKTQAFQLKEDAWEMESYARQNLAWEHHNEAVNKIKDHINTMGRLVTKLDDARDAASPWQQTAIDRIKPLLRELAANTTAVIEYLNTRPKRLVASDYKDYLEANADHADELAALVSNFVSYGKTKRRMEHLADTLEIPRPTTF